MAIQQHRFAVPRELKLDDLKSRLERHLALTPEAVHSVERVFYDTFDWRLHAANSTLEEQSAGDEHRLSYRALDTERLRASAATACPRFAWDLPSGPLRDALEPIVEMRALLPRARVKSRVHAFKVLNKEDKTILRVALEENRAVDLNNGKTRRLGKLFRLMPVRGYNKPLQRAQKVLQSDLNLVPVEEDVALLALNSFGSQPGDYSSKLKIRLDPTERADAAMRLILLTLLNTLQVNEEGVKQDLDSEFLHDFRVAVRRTRSALGQIKGVLPQRSVDRFRQEFAWLGQITGPTRDLDVYLLKFDGYRESLPPAVRENLDPLRAFLRSHQNKEQALLASELESPRYRKIIKDWRKYLESPLPKQPTLANARRTVAVVASERIWRVYKRVLKEGGAITAGSPAESLHELRKTCKKLRYLIEFFQSLYPEQQVKQLIKALKTLQEVLGDFQDLEVQQLSLKRFSQEMSAEGQVPAETLMAMGILIHNLGERQQQARDAFAQRFSAFASQQNQSAFRELFAATVQAEAA